MKAMRIHQYGDVSVIRHDDVPRPVPGDGQVLLHVAATSFNPSEIGLRRGLLRSVFPLDLPYTLGGDVAGVVAEVGAGVSAFAVGDRVIGRLDGGAAAEYAIAPAEVLVAAPASVPLAHAAAMPIAGVTAWQAVEHADLKPGRRVLVNGTGAVGRFAVQLAKHLGAYVIATAGPRGAEAVRRLGADRIVDYTTTSVVDALDEPVDALLNFAVIDSSQAAELVPLIRPGGVLVSATVEVGQFATAQLRAVRFVVRNDTDHLAALVKLVDAGVVRVDVAASRPLTELPSVHREAETGRLPGKTVLVPGRSPV
ncbi:NADP-dependent oxidoreductase [Acrocarpospora catenulata]|uniref:NADP-dependent oxidoreductase n=1 Tax=Acrocarpospora catenulata TaxID=2836182 RepID=UPI001BDA7FF7|nr:NADP-dependent oxidoreductase [Acrocarpospora catenulata]